MTEEEMRQALVDGCHQAHRQGLNSGTAGNFSIRNQNAMLITPSGFPYSDMRPDMMVVCDFDGNHQGPWLPSSEWQMHAEIYRAFPAAGAVVHAHPDHCVALSCLRERLPPFHYMVASFGGDDVPCSRYERFGGPALALAAVDALADRNACLLANHGMICFAGTIEKAVSNAAKLEMLARQYLLARSAGQPVLLNGEEMAQVRDRYTTYGQQPLKSHRPDSARDS